MIDCCREGVKKYKKEFPGRKKQLIHEENK